MKYARCVQLFLYVNSTFTLSFPLDDSSTGREGDRPAGESEYSTDLTGKLGKVLQSSTPLISFIPSIFNYCPESNYTYALQLPRQLLVLYLKKQNSTVELFLVIVLGASILVELVYYDIPQYDSMFYVCGVLEERQRSSIDVLFFLWCTKARLQIYETMCMPEPAQKKSFYKSQSEKDTPKVYTLGSLPCLVLLCITSSAYYFHT